MDVVLVCQLQSIVMKNIAKYRNMFNGQEETSIIKYELPSFINKNTDEVKEF